MDLAKWAGSFPRVPYRKMEARSLGEEKEEGDRRRGEVKKDSN